MSKLKQSIPTAQLVVPVLDGSLKSNPESVDITDCWKDAPPAVAALVLDVWLGWKGNSGMVPVRSLHIDGFDFDMQLALKAVPEVTVTKRVSSVFRASHQLTMTKYQGDMDTAKRDLAFLVNQIDGMNHNKDALEAAKKTKADKEYINQLSDALDGWDVREAELMPMVDAHKAKIEEMSGKIADIESIDTRKVDTWFFTLDQI